MRAAGNLCAAAQGRVILGHPPSLLSQAPCAWGPMRIKAGNLTVCRGVRQTSKRRKRAHGKETSPVWEGILFYFIF